MGIRCEHSLCDKPAEFSAGISEDASHWITGNFCAAHAARFTEGEAFVDMRRLEPIPREALNGSQL